MFLRTYRGVILLLERETHALLYSLENELFIQYGNSRLTWKQNVVVHKWDPNLSDFRYHNVNCHVSHSALSNISTPH